MKLLKIRDLISNYMSLRILSLNLKELNSTNVNLVHKFMGLIEEYRLDFIFLHEIQHQNIHETLIKLITNDSHDLKLCLGANSAIVSKYPFSQRYDFVLGKPGSTIKLLMAQVKIREDFQPMVCNLTMEFSFFNLVKEYEELKLIVNSFDPDRNKPVIISGNFHDWNQSTFAKYEGLLNIKDAFKSFKGEYARTYPSNVPLLCLDRIYYRQFRTIGSEVLYNESGLFNHLPLFCEIKPVIEDSLVMNL